jgi:hypothetical protein
MLVGMVATKPPYQLEAQFSPSYVQLNEISLLTKKKHTIHASFNMQVQGKVNQNDMNLRWWKIS